MWKWLRYNREGCFLFRVTYAVILATLIIMANCMVTSSVAEETVILYPINDTYVRSYSPSVNYGVDIYLLASRQTSNYYISTSFLMFDLSSLPPSATLSHAELQLRRRNSTPIPLPVEVHSSPDTQWNEATLTYLSALSIPLYDASDTVTVNAEAEWFNWTVTGDVQSAYNTVDKRLTLVLKLPDTKIYTSTQAYIQFYSKDDASEVLRPRLIISYMKQSSSVTLNLAESSITVGSPMAITGAIYPKAFTPTSQTFVILTFGKPDFTQTTVATTVIGNSYTYEFTPDLAGEWSVYASWRGCEGYAGSASDTATFTVAKAQSTVTLNIAETEASALTPITLTGILTPRPANTTQVTLAYTNPIGTTTQHIVQTIPDGRYHDTFTPDQTGVWTVKAQWLGDSNHEASESQPTQLTITPLQSIITLQTAQPTAVIQHPSTVRGSTNLPDTPLTLTYTHPDGSTIQYPTATDPTGSFNHTITPTTLGEWKVEARFPGDSLRTPASTTPIPFLVKEVPPLTLSLSVTTTQPNTNITLTGDIDWNNTVVPITIESALLTESEIEYTPIASINTTATGEYTYIWTTPEEEGEYSLRAVAFPNSTQQSIYSIEETLAITTTPPPPLATSMTLALPTQTIEFNSEVKVSGNIQPPKADVPITILYRNAEGQTIQRTAITNPDGSFTDTYAPTTTGSWMIQAAIENSNINAPTLLFTVAESTLTPETTEPLPMDSIIIGIIIAVVIISAVTTAVRRRRPAPSTAIVPTVSQLLAEPPGKVAENLLKTSTLDTAKIMTLLPADRAAEVIKAMKEKTREAVEGKPSTKSPEEEEG